MDLIALTIFITAILAFITWMFWEMAGNTEPGKLPPCFIRFTGDNRTDWIFAFVLLNLFTAVYYFLKVFNAQQPKR